MIRKLEINTNGQGLYEVTPEVRAIIRSSAVEEGLCTVFCQHTSASLIIQENADPSAKRDLEKWFKRLVAENDALFTHTQEGPDDMPSHIKSALTASSLSIPVFEREIMLGTWQGIYVWEHRNSPHHRSVVVHVL